MTEEFELVGKIGKEKIYHKKSLFEVPSDRVFACLRNIYFINNWSAGKEEIERYLKALRIAFDEQRLVDVGSIISLIEVKVNQQPQTESYIDLACNYYYLENEGDELNAKFVSKKRELFESEQGGFFLTLAAEVLTNYKEKSKSDFRKYFKTTESKMLKLLGILPKN